MSNWVHIRNWPLVIKSLVANFEDPAISLGLILHEIVERLTAVEYFPYEIVILEEKIMEYLDLRKSLRSDFPNLMRNPKPKHHFLRGYIVYLSNYKHTQKIVNSKIYLFYIFLLVV